MADSPLRSGYLLIASSSLVPTWKKYWFSLTLNTARESSPQLTWFTNNTQKFQKGCVSLAQTDAIVRNVKTPRAGKHAFRIDVSEKGSNKKLILSGETAIDTNEWIKAMETAGTKINYAFTEDSGQASLHDDGVDDVDVIPDRESSASVKSIAEMDKAPGASPNRTSAAAAAAPTRTSEAPTRTSVAPTRTSAAATRTSAAAPSVAAAHEASREETAPLYTAAPSDEPQPMKTTGSKGSSSPALLLFLLLVVGVGLVASQFPTATSTLMDKINKYLFTPSDDEMCEDGLLIPGPLKTGLSTIIFMLLLLWTFLGVAVAADTFMNAIEVITSQETQTEIQVDNEMKKFTVRVWNGTVANLTLMALGSSAPEILLSMIEIGSNGFYSGALGPSTIVGSAAFNLFIISAVCVLVIPGGAGRYIKDTKVFAITATFSVFAYLYLAFILTISSPNIITVTEGLVTLFLFPLLVFFAYFADIGAFSKQKSGASSTLIGLGLDGKWITREDIAQVVAKNVDASSAGVDEANIAKFTKQLLSGSKHSRAVYRNQAVRGSLNGNSIDLTKGIVPLTKVEVVNPVRIAFEAAEVAFDESAKSAVVNVKCSPAPEVSTQMLHKWSGRVSYETISGTAVEKKHFKPVSGTLYFKKGKLVDTIRVPLIDNSEQNDDRTFEISLKSPSKGADLGPQSTCSVTIVDDDGPGVLLFSESNKEVLESAKKVAFKVVRRRGVKGEIGCSFSTKDGNALEHMDYIPREGKLVFKHGEVEKKIIIEIVDDGRMEREETFQLVLTDATGGATFDEETDGFKEREIATIRIVSDDVRNGIIESVSALMDIDLDHVDFAKSTYKEQFTSAIQLDFSVGPLYILLQLLSLPFKVVFSFVPPPKVCGGYPAFIVALAFIGALTALVGDLAAHMGCAMGLPSSITAITFVALGTSLPDTFASKTAAINEEHADASIGNITGSNSVNVFLGLGLPWAAAAIYWSIYGSVKEVEAGWRLKYEGEPWYTPDMPVGFVVQSGDLGFSVGVFSVLAILCLLALVLRRRLYGFELGGPSGPKVLTGLLFVAFWFVYVTLSVLKTLGYI